MREQPSLFVVPPRYVTIKTKSKHPFREKMLAFTSFSQK